MTRSLTSIAFALVLVAISRPAAAQGGRDFYDPATFDEPARVLSTNPIGVALRYYNLEYEARVHDTLTAGIGGARLDGSIGLGHFANTDVFVRYYPGGRAFRGVSLGLKTGLTTVGQDSLAAGVGVDVNGSHWITERVVVSAGVGMKRVFDGTNTFTMPTIRIINVGVAF